MGAVLLVYGAWSLIKLLAAVESLLRSCIEKSLFPFDIPLVDCLRLQTALNNRSACVIVGYVIFLCCKTTVSDTRLELVFLTLHMWERYCSGDVYKYQTQTSWLSHDVRALEFSWVSTAHPIGPRGILL